MGLVASVFMARGHGACASEAIPAAWRWESYSHGLPSYALVVSVALQPTDPDVLYAGTYEPPGLWRSDDRGRSWEVDDSGLEGSPVYALQWDTVRSRWWAGTRDGLYTRSDADAPWRAARLGEHTVYAVARDEKGRLYAATEEGLFWSDDAGSWEAMPIADGQAKMAILALSVSKDGRSLMVGTAGQGLWSSRDGGATWSPAGSPSTGVREAHAEAYVTAVLLDPKASGAAYASTSERSYRSADGGVTWQPIPDLDSRAHAFAVGADGSVYAALVGQVARSPDGSRTWEQHGSGLRPDDRVLDLAASAADPDLLYAAAWDGLYASTDGGRNWLQRGNNLGYPDVNALAWDGSGNLLVGTRSGLYRRAPNATAWEAVPDIEGRPVLTMAGAGDGRNFYAGCSGGLFRSTDGGRTWSEVISELTDVGIAGLVVDPANSDHLHAWAAFGRVHESWDGGQTWVARWEGLGNVRPVTAIHRTGAGRLYVGAEDGLFRWEPASEAWQLLSLPLIAPTVFVVGSDARDAEALYAGATDGLWRSADGGKSWSRWGKGLEGKTVTALAISPADRRNAFAGTRHMGLYVTTDRGETWQPAWQDRLKTASVRDVLFSRDGGVVYVASDQGVLRGGSDGAH
jgi:photosystem II stability/assembly factor-like uncharacterized protein